LEKTVAQPAALTFTNLTNCQLMYDLLPDIFALINDVLQAIIVIFGSAVVLYNLGRSLRIPVMRAFCALISFVVLVYLAEMLVSRTIVSDTAQSWLEMQWVNIALVPAALYHLSETLLAITRATLNPRRPWVWVIYGSSAVIGGIIVFTNLIAGEILPQAGVPTLQTGPLFPFFALYFWVVTAVSIYNVWRARQRCITTTTRQRMTTTLLALLAAPLAVFPYLALSGSQIQEVPLFLWLILIGGNIVVSIMFALLTAHLIYFGAASPDRVVRVRLYKYMARVPLAGSIVLLVYVLVSRGSPILGLDTATALGFTMVVTVMLVEWAIHAYKRPLERIFQLDNDPDVRRIQQLSDRVLTTSDLQQFLEIILSTACETLRTPTAFVAAITESGPRLEAVVGPLAQPDGILQDANWQELSVSTGNGQSQPDLEMIGDFIVWQDYWIRPLYNESDEMVLGIFGIRARSAVPDFNEVEMIIFDRLLDQTAGALADRILQQEVFAAVEGLLPEITALQERRSAATFGGLPVLTDAEQEALIDDPDEFKNLVRDALSHYWGGPKLTGSPLLGLQVVQRALEEHDNNPTNALRAILGQAIELQKPEGQRSMTTAEWILYNILEMKFVQGKKVRDVARRLAMSESDLYRKQRVAIENVARTIVTLEQALREAEETDHD
jgi:hypothetical protein